MTFLRFLLMISFIGIAGWSVRCFFVSSNQREDDEKLSAIGSVLEEYFLTFLTGFGISSILLFFIALAGWFEIKVILIVFSILPAFCFAIQRFHKRDWWSLRFRKYLLICLIFGSACFGLGNLAKPFEAVIHADDASVYIGAAFQLAKSGSLSYKDPLVVEMTQEERNQIFNNRFASDTTGEKIRYPGGVRLINPSTGAVVFSFYHLFPVWLAVGIQTLGEHFFLNLLTLFLALKLISLFLLGRELGGLLLGISIPLLCFFFYPQLYFSLMPTSELLTEALFLSGLWVFFSGIKSQPVLNSGQQTLVGILWGALFLSRLETLFMLCLSLILVFTTLPAFSKNWSKWRILIMHLVFFLFLAIYYQIARGEYLYVFTSGQFLGNQPIVLIGIELLNSTIWFVQNNPLLGFLTFLSVTTVVLACLWLILRANGRQRLWFKAVVGILFVSISLAAMVGPWASWPRFVKHVHWVSLYFSYPILLTLFAGTLFFLYRIIREGRSAALTALFIMFLLPAISYLVRPLIIIEQPWGIRKFVPMVFPLFFLVSLTGWFYYLEGILLRPRFLARTVFCALVVLLTGFFWGESRYLLKGELFANLIAQTRSLASTIPKNGLIVVPESWASTHVQIPLQYLAGRDTILLPVEKSWNNNVFRAMNSFLARQIKRRPVMVLLKSSQDPPITLRSSFRLRPVSKNNLSFEHVPRTHKMEFPDHLEKVSLNYTVFNMIKKEKEYYEKSLIRFDDPDVTFVDFYDKEDGFRWTQEKSVIKDFAFRIDKENTTIIISTLSGHSYYGLDDQGIRLLINDRIPTTLIKRVNADFYFDIDEIGLSEIISLTIFSKTFVPLEKGINLDPRRLGICFSKLTLQRG